jgi:hypothetical protein
VLIPRFTEDHRQELLLRGEESLWAFTTGILGLDDFDEELGLSTLSPEHERLCLFLEGKLIPWRFAEVCAFRGFGKSTWCKSYMLWRCLYRVNFAAKIMCNSSDNARDIHFLPLIRIFTESQRADFLSAWLFAHRIPEGFAGWNSEQMVLVRTNPLAEVAITYWGIESKKEGSHPDFIWASDLEGAEAEKSSAANKASWSAWTTMPPLLRDRRKGQILLDGTPWGSEPLVWKIRDAEDGGSLDNAKRRVKIFWMPLVGETGNADDPSPWPIRFPPDVVKEMLTEEVADQQYLLRRANRRADLFDLDAVTNFYYTKDTFEPSVLRYETVSFDPDKLDELGHAQGTRRPASVRLEELRFFLHVDPLHRPSNLRKTVGGQRPALFAILVAGVAPDGHVFVIETWTQEGPDLNVQADKVFSYYRKYAPHLVTFESVGAQVWFLAYVLKRESDSALWGRPTSTPGVLPKMDLPRLSSRLIEAEKTNQAKDYLYRSKLAAWLNPGLIHLHKSQVTLLHQLQHALDESQAVDLLDCLVQGCGRILTVDKDGKRRHDYGKIVWSRPIGKEIRESLHQQEAVQERRRDRRTGYASPWR